MTNIENVWGNRNYDATIKDVVIAVLQDEIEVAKGRIQPTDTGHLHDYVSRLNDRIKEIGKVADEGKLTMVVA